MSTKHTTRKDRRAEVSIDRVANRKARLRVDRLDRREAAREISEARR